MINVSSWGSQKLGSIGEAGRSIVGDVMGLIAVLRGVTSIRPFRGIIRRVGL